jgi:hypothetical protein
MFSLGILAARALSTAKRNLMYFPDSLILPLRLRQCNNAGMFGKNTTFYFIIGSFFRLMLPILNDLT